MADIKVAVINASTVLRDGQIKDALPALQTQVRRDFAPVWGIDADLIFVPAGKVPPAGAWWLVILDNSDIAGVLGYHDVTDEGLPLGKVFAASDLHQHLQWTVAASHELLEMLADPDLNLAALAHADPHSLSFYAYEVCDPCGGDEHGYKIDGVLVSDFVYPAWFESFHRPHSTRFDHCGHLKEPAPKLLPGGYILSLSLTAGTGWHQVSGEKHPVRVEMRSRLGSRRERRRTPRNAWVTSKVKFTTLHGK